MRASDRRHPLPTLSVPPWLLSASPGHSLEVLTPAPLTRMLGTGFLRKPPEMLQLPGPGWMMLVAVETAGPDPGIAAFSLHLGPAPLP